MATSASQGSSPTGHGWAVDLDGVIWLGDQPIAGSASAIAALRQGGTDVLFVTNNSSVTVAEQEAKLASHGIEASGAVVTSAVVAAELVDPAEVALVCGGPGIREALERRGVRTIDDGRCDVVVVGFHRDFTYDRLRVAARAIEHGARFLATNDDATYPTPSGPIPGGGAIVAAVAYATGVDPIVAGKPNAPAVDLVHRRLGTRGVMVGDRPETDGGFAVALGYQFALVLSGVTKRSDLPVEPSPAWIADDLAAAVAAWSPKSA